MARKRSARVLRAGLPCVRLERAGLNGQENEP